MVDNNPQAPLHVAHRACADTGGEAERKTWWPNLRGAADVDLLIRGRRLKGRAEVLTAATDPDQLRRGLQAYFKKLPGRKLPCPGTPTCSKACLISARSAPAISSKVSSTRDLRPSRAPAGMRPRASRSFSEPGKP